MSLCVLAASFVCGQDPLSILPKNYRLVYENEYVRVIRVTYAAHEKLPLHDHPDKPTVYVYLSDSGRVRFSHVEEHPFTIVRPPEKAGTFRVSPGRVERHTVENLGDIPSEFFRVELKQVPLGFQPASFRSSKSFDTAHTGVATEFSGPLIKIQRIIAQKDQTVALKTSQGPVLLVAFSPASVHSGRSAAKPKVLNRGDVLWLDLQSSCTIGSPGQTNEAANVLQIVFLPKN